MNKISLGFIITVIFSLISCADNKPEVPVETISANKSIDTLQQIQQSKNESVNFETSVEPNTKPMLISIFTKVPDEIEGCACYFSKNKEDLETSDFLFAANYDSAAFISINQKLIKLKLISSTRNPGTFGDYDHVDIYQANGYKVTVDLHYKKSTGDEVWEFTGTLILTRKDGKKAETQLYGQCGC